MSRKHNFHHRTATDVVLPFAYGDRFIPRRYTGSKKPYKDQSFQNCETNQQDILGLKSVDGYWRQNGLRDSLDDQFDFHPHQRVFSLHEWITESICKATLNRRPTLEIYEQRYRNQQKMDWPCVPRSRPAAFTTSTHDLPGFNRFSHLNIIAWSCTGKIAASFGFDLVLWMPDSDATVVYRLEGIKALKHSFDGKMLAVGVKEKSTAAELQVWNVESKAIYIYKYFTYQCGPSEVRCIVWDPNDRFILCGMSNGLIYVHRFPSLHPQVVLKMHKDCVLDIQLSMNQKYFASCDVTGFVLVWYTNTFHPFVKCLESSEALIAWHPWKEDDLIVASALPGKIRLLNITSNSIVAYYRRLDQNFRIDAITFNPLSAELVVSIAVVADDGSVENEILVMASMDRVVDRLVVHEKSVYFLMWDPNGTHLATAGDDETLHIWDFFAYPKHYLKPKLRNRMRKKEYKTDPFSSQNSLLGMR